MSRADVGGFRIARIAGIDLMLHWSLAAIVLLVATSVAAGEIPNAHPDWSSTAAWITGLMSAAGLITSIVLHELAHSLVAQRLGVRVPRITLFAFGGMAHIAQAPRRAAHEFAITIAGPLTSIVLGLTLLGLTHSVDSGAAAGVGTILAEVGLLIGQVNLALGIFNCLPGAPLDGGRILHAIIWRTTGDKDAATRISTIVGEMVGISIASLGMLMLLGANLPYLGTGAGGLWLALIGSFIAILARNERTSAAIDEVAATVPVSQLARTLVAVDAETPLSEFTDGVLLPTGERAATVVRDNQLIGLASMSDALTVAAQRRPVVPVRAVMTPWNALHMMSSTASIADAARTFAELGVHQLPVTDDGRVIGFVHRHDVTTWLQLHAPSQPTATEAGKHT